MAGKKGEGRVQLEIMRALRQRAQTTESLKVLTHANRGYIQHVLCQLVKAGKVLKTGVASPQGGCVYKLARGGVKSTKG